LGQDPEEQAGGKRTQRPRDALPIDGSSPHLATSVLQANNVTQASTVGAVAAARTRLPVLVLALARPPDRCNALGRPGV
jgi:hypothetical protein